jgi:NAD(P)-dependent dehydrogenase (short-subunit alcohol dehydrogenase family)
VRIDGSVALVTGASSGIGLATARELAWRGARVVAAARRIDRLRGLVDELEHGTGRPHLAVEADVASRPDIDRLVGLALGRFGHLDVLVNNAGTGRGRHLLASTDAELERLFAVNLLGPARLIQAVVPRMRRGGVVVNVGSVAGEGPGQDLYAVSKVAVRSLTHGLRPELALRGIGVVLVEPGFIRTELTANLPLWRLMPGPEVVARRIAEAVERPQRTIVVPWYYVPLIWGMRLTPGPVMDAALQLARRARS